MLLITSSASFSSNSSKNSLSRPFSSCHQSFLQFPSPPIPSRNLSLDRFQVVINYLFNLLLLQFLQKRKSYTYIYIYSLNQFFHLSLDRLQVVINYLNLLLLKFPFSSFKRFLSIVFELLSTTSTSFSSNSSLPFSKKFFLSLQICQMDERYQEFPSVLCVETNTENAHPHLLEGLPVAIQTAGNEDATDDEKLDMYAFALVIYFGRLYVFVCNMAFFPRMSQKSSCISVGQRTSSQHTPLSSHTWKSHWRNSEAQPGIGKSS